jgi:TonB family protein
MAASRSGLIVIATLVWAICMGGCRTTQPAAASNAAHVGSVGMEIVLPPPGAAEMELAATQRFVFPRQHEPVVLPVYPPQRLGQSLHAVEVCVEVDIGADGQITQARMNPDPHCGKRNGDATFLQAALDAVRQWRFEPAMLCTAPDTTFADACLHPEMIEAPTAVRLSYAFRYSQREGRSVVEQVRNR